MLQPYMLLCGRGWKQEKTLLEPMSFPAFEFVAPGIAPFPEESELTVCVCVCACACACVRARAVSHYVS